MTGPAARTVTFVRDHGVGVGRELLFNFVLPYLIYSYGEAPWGQVHALMASSAPPLVWTLIEFARHRRIDAVSLLVLAGIGLSLLAFLGGGGIRFLQLREKLVTVGIGLVFLGSAAIGRPLFHHLFRAMLKRSGAPERDQFGSLKDNPPLRRAMTLLTLVWGTGLVAEATLAALLAFTLPVRQYLLVAPVMGYVTFSSLGLWTFLYGRSQRRKAEAHRSAEAMKGAHLPQ